jgi:manganese-dependent ADP-ribose/CDP-alcohol diphosphatase
MPLRSFRFFAFSLISLFFSFGGFGQVSKPLRIGIFTDCQYCNCSHDEVRLYTLSLPKIDSTISTFNTLQLDAVFHLGDMIDHNFVSFDSVLPRFRKFTAPMYMVLGNHDYMIESEKRPGLLKHIGMKEAYYVVEIESWTFIILNGNDLSYFGPQTKEQRKERNLMLGELFASFKLNGMPWNGGIGSVQMRWLDNQLSIAQKNNRNVIVLCHFPLFSKGHHNLFNHDEVFALINSYTCCKAYFNGHYHAGGYTEANGLHLVNFRGMVDTYQNAFGVVTLTSDSILIDGYGREPDRRLKVRK